MVRGVFGGMPRKASAGRKKSELGKAVVDEGENAENVKIDKKEIVVSKPAEKRRKIVKEETTVADLVPKREELAIKSEEIEVEEGKG